MKKIYEVKLKYIPPTSGEHRVFVAGSFNDWQKQEMRSESGNYVISLQVPAGKYPYKFLIDGHWEADPAADFFEDDRMGGRNSLLIVKDTFEPLFIVPVSFIPDTSDIFSVALTGSFNEWNIGHTLLQRSKNGEFRTNLLLTEGIYQYKFVLNNKIWLTDKTNPEQISDNRGGFNSILKVDDKCRRYDPETEEIFTYDLIDKHYPKAETVGCGWVRFSCRVYKNNVDKVFVTDQNTRSEMTKFFSNSRYDYFSLMMPETGHDFYDIALQKNGKCEKLNPAGSFRITRHSGDLIWLQKSVLYQIFCDRFCNGDAALNPDFSEWYYDAAKNPLSPPVQGNLYRLEKDWNNHQILKNDENRHHIFYGGDLPGVRQKLSYLKELGITCLYFNPLVLGESNHKYDTFDYLQVDPHFGGNDCFRELVLECHAQGIAVILDFAFNHVGTGFFAFQDCLKKGKRSKFFNWFDWYKSPLPGKIPPDFKAAEYYQCWWDHATLPDLNFDLDRLHPDENYIHDSKDANANQPLVDYLLNVVGFWLMEMDIDGFRLDVPNEVPFWFWKLFRAKVKSLKPSAYLVGEIWQNAEEWLGNHFDAVMNYSFFREPVLQFFALANRAKQQFLEEMITGLHRYGFHNLSLMMNLLDSHDTYRFLEAGGGDLRKLKLALLFQAGWIGVPHIFYGDEVGMMGANDPDNRRPMNWNYENNPELVDLHDYVQKILALRKSHQALIFGDLIIPANETELIVFRRILDDEEILIVINNADQRSEYILEEKYLNLLSGKIETGKIQILPFEGSILKKNG